MRDSLGTVLSIRRSPTDYPTNCARTERASVGIDNAGNLITVDSLAPTTPGIVVCRFIIGDLSIDFSTQVTTNNLPPFEHPFGGSLVSGLDSNNNLIILSDSDTSTWAPDTLEKYNTTTGSPLWGVGVPVDLSSMYGSLWSDIMLGPEGLIVDDNDNIIIYGMKPTNVPAPIQNWDQGVFHAIKYDSNGLNPIQYNTPVHGDYSTVLGRDHFGKSVAFSVGGYFGYRISDFNVDTDSGGNLYYYGVLDRQCKTFSTPLFWDDSCDDLLQIYSPQGELACAHSEDIPATYFEAMSVEVGNGGEIYLGSLQAGADGFISNTYLTKYTPTLPDIDIGLRLFDGAATVPIAVKSAPKVKKNRGPFARPPIRKRRSSAQTLGKRLRFCAARANKKPNAPITRRTDKTGNSSISGCQ